MAGEIKRTITLYAQTPPGTRADRLTENTLHKAIFPEFVTESGVRIVNLRTAYRVFGKPSPARDNIILVFHALTGDANCAGYQGPEGWVEGWWEPLFRTPGRTLDLERWCVVCPNHPGGCYGSSGPTDTEVGGAEPLGPDFPDFTPRDLVRVHHRLLDELGFSRPKLVIGGSLGGMLALEWAATFPDAACNAAVIAAPASANAQSVAFNHIQRKCFELDRDFKGGRYYGGARPAMALALARQIAMITYRNDVEFSERFGRKKAFQPEPGSKYYEVEQYLDHQGEKLVRRFDPNSYLKLLRTLDDHDVFRGREDHAALLGAVAAKLLFVWIDTDILYPPADVRALYDAARAAGADARCESIASLHGHDAFLIEYEQLERILAGFMKEG